MDGTVLMAQRGIIVEAINKTQLPVALCISRRLCLCVMWYRSVFLKGRLFEHFKILLVVDISSNYLRKINLFPEQCVWKIKYNIRNR